MSQELGKDTRETSKMEVPEEKSTNNSLVKDGSGLVAQGGPQNGQKIQDSQNHQIDQKIQDRYASFNIKRRSKRMKNYNFYYSESEDQEEENEMEKVVPSDPIFCQPIESIHGMRQNGEKKEFLIKYKNLSYRKCHWMNEEDIMSYDPAIKNKLKRFVRDRNQGIHQPGELVNYETYYTQIDKILNISVLFPVIHPKKGNQVKKQWTFNLLKVLKFLVNFENDGIFYGLELVKMSERFQHFPHLENNLDIVILINRVYLDYYKEPIQFWLDLLVVLDNYLTLHYSNQETDQFIIHYRLKELSKMAYQQWKKIHQEDYQKLKIFYSKRYSEISFGEFNRDYFNVFSLTQNHKQGGFIASIEGIMKNHEEFIRNKEDIGFLMEKIKKHKKELDLLKESPQCQEQDLQVKKNDLKKLMSQIQMEINTNIEYFQIMFKKQNLSNLNMIYEMDEGVLGELTKEIDLGWCQEINNFNINQPMQNKYYVKWKGLSYLDCSWEEENFVVKFPEKIKEFMKFNRALLRQERKEYLERFEYNNRLRQIYESQRKYSKTSPKEIYKLQWKVFGLKDVSDIYQYSLMNQPKFKGPQRLRNYQIDSLNWMIKAWTQRRNIILADEMGLGKTIQAMSFVNHLIQVEKLNGPYLIIAPLSTLSHWLRVFRQWSKLNCILYYDSKGKQGRKKCREEEWYRNDITQKGYLTKLYKICKFQVIITSFEVFLQDFNEVFEEIPFQHLIIDEAHRLKNKNAKIISVLRQLICKRIFLLTGTPIQNNIEELWSLLNFIEPDNFQDFQEFSDNFGDLTNVQQLEKLKVKLEPFLLRRMKEDVESSIPPLQEIIIDIELTNIQKVLYKTIYEKSKGTLEKGLGLKFVSMMNNLEMQLRKCCNHPFMLQGFKDNLFQENPTREKYKEKIVSSSGKMIFLDKMIQKFKRENKKMLIFSQFTETLSIIQEYLTLNGIRYRKIDGSTKAKDRQKAIDKFNLEPEKFEIFLLSTKAGGIGINLTSAKVVIIYDSDWNPQNDVQAIARAHRIGQTEEVKVFRMVSKNTYESVMFERASKKLGLDQAIFLSGDFAQKSKENKKQEDMKNLQPQEIELLLKKGILGLINSQDQKSEEEHFKMDIEQVISEARVANYSFSKSSYTFSKGLFNTTSKENKVNLNDPDFWKKVFKDTKNEAQKLTKEFKKNVKSGLFRLIDIQKEIVLKLSSGVHQYMTNRVKNNEFDAKLESDYENLIMKLLDNQELKKALQIVVNEIHKAFKKKSRRIKKIDEKYINSLLKKQANLQKYKIQNFKSGSKEGNEEIYYNSDSDYEEKQDVKKFQCDLCQKEGANVLCLGNNQCRKMYHRKCVQKKLREDLEKVKGVLDQEINAECVKDQCCFCRLGVVQCFQCGEYQKKEEENIIFCGVCSKTYHKKCLNDNKNLNEKQICQRHHCHACQEIDEDLFRCLLCPNSYHKKCIPKKCKKLKKKTIICPKHIKEKKKKKDKKIKKKEDYQQYDFFKISPPETFEYLSSKEPWCYYCGARYSEKFYDSPYGAQTLCLKHHKSVKKKNLKKHILKKTPIPIYLSKNTELDYLNNQ